MGYASWAGRGLRGSYGFLRTRIARITRISGKDADYADQTDFGGRGLRGSQAGRGLRESHGFLRTRMARIPRISGRTRITRIIRISADADLRGSRGISGEDASGSNSATCPPRYFPSAVLRDSEYCAASDRHPYRLSLAIEDIEHTRTKAQSPNA